MARLRAASSPCCGRPKPSTTAAVRTFCSAGGAEHDGRERSRGVGEGPGRAGGAARAALRAGRAAPALAGVPARAARALGAQERLAAGRGGGRPHARRDAGLPLAHAPGRRGGPGRPPGLRRRAARRSRRGAGAGRDRVREEGREVGGRAAAVQRHRGPRRELSGRGLPRLREPARPRADRPRAVPAGGLGGRRGPPRRGRRAAGDRLHHQAQARGGDAGAGAGRRRAVLVGDGRQRPRGRPRLAARDRGARRARLRPGGDQRLGFARVDAWAAGLPPEAWHRLSAGEGAKGPRLHDWAYTPYRGGAPTGREKGLLVRRELDEPDDLAFYLTLAPEGTGLATLVRVAGTRWTFESCFEAAKGEVGLDEYEVRSWTGWHRHVTLAMLAYAYLAAVRKAAAGGRGAARPGRGAAAADRAGGAAPGVEAGLGTGARSRRRPRLVALAPPPQATRPPLPLATPDRLA